jgi:BlaI family transcriptional regulator, penicillinase repressor
MKGKNPNPTPVPSKGEMEILQVLWQHGPSTVRFVHETLNADKSTLYTSTLKVMQVMAEKGLVDRDESQMKHVYSAALAEDSTKKTMLNQFVESIYNGSPSSLMMALLDNKTPDEEVKKIRELLKNFEGK